MCLARLRLAVFIAIVVSYTVAAASPSTLKGVASTSLSSRWLALASKVLPAATAVALLFVPLSLDAVLDASAPVLRPLHHQGVTRGEEYVGRSVFFTREGVGQRGFVATSDGYSVRIVIPSSLAVDGAGGYDEVTLALDRVEALVDWDYRVIGNFVAFAPEGNQHGLELEKIAVPLGVTVLDDGRLVFDGEEQREVVFGVVAAATEDGRYVIRPYYHTPLAFDPHDGGTEPLAHRNASPLLTKHLHHLNTDLYLVPKENIFSGLGQVVLEETEINAPFFLAIADYDRQRNANAAAQRDGLPLPYEEGASLPPPAVSVYHTGAYTAADFVGKVIYYYGTDDSKYLAYAEGQHEGEVAVFLPGGRDKKLIAVEQIRAASIEDGSGMFGNGISFVTGSAYPLNHSVRWQGRRFPGARGVVWGGQVADSAIVTVLDNGLMVVKVQIDSGNSLYANYHLYLIHNKSMGVLHYGNHRHH